MESLSPPITLFEVLDPEALAAAIRHANLQPCQLSARPKPSVVARVRCPRVCFDFAALGPAMLFTGSMARDCFTLMFVLECPNEGHSFNFGIRHTAGYMGFFPPGGELDAYTPEGYANATIAVPVAEFHAMLELHVPGIPDRILSHGAGMRIGLEEQARLRAVLTEVMAGVRDPAAPLASPLARQQVERTLLEVFLAALRQGCGDCAPASTQRMAGRWRRLRQGRDFIAAHSREPVHLDDLCSAMDLSRRAVEMVFRETLGLSPLAFARHQRLHGARRALRDTRPAPGMVKKVALDWGFFHLGRFSRIYRQLFGEGPSETMMRHRGMG